VECAQDLYRRIVDEAWIYHSTIPVKGFRRYPILQFAGGPDYVAFPGSVTMLSVEEWILAMGIFNHYEPLSDIEKTLLSKHMIPIFQAMLVGLLDVTIYGARKIRYGGSFRPPDVFHVPQFPELVCQRYVFLTKCDMEVD